MRNPHYMVGTRLYRVWSNMKSRCLNPNSDQYKWYGARGICVDQLWQNFQPFMKWALENGYSEEMELDRIDNDKNYSPENCRWITHKEQCRNRRSNHRVRLDGKEMLLTDAAKEVGKSYAAIIYRLKRGKGDIEDVNGKTRSLEDACQ